MTVTLNSRTLTDFKPNMQYAWWQVASERNDREQFLRSGVNPAYGGVRQNGTYSSHPNLPTFDPPAHPSQLPAFPPIEPPTMQKMAPLPRPPVRLPFISIFLIASCRPSWWPSCPGWSGWKPSKAACSSKTTFFPQIANMAPGLPVATIS